MQACVSSRHATRHFKLEIKMSSISLTIPQKAAEATQAPEKPSHIGFGVGVAIVLTLLAILSVATGVAPIVDPTVFPLP
jgi:hypothetical protein